MTREKTHSIFVISGVAGAGKDSVIAPLRNNTDRFSFSVTYTDRPMRPGEVDGKSYNFISEDNFDRAITNDEFLEWERVRGNHRYGIIKKDFEQLIHSDKIVIQQIDVKGMLKLQKMYPVCSIFVIPPSLEEAERRLRARSNDTQDGLKVRLDRYDFEMSFKDKYDYILVNDDLNRAQQELLDIIAKETR